MGNTVSSIALPVILVYSNDATRCLEVSMEKALGCIKFLEMWIVESLARRRAKN